VDAAILDPTAAASFGSKPCGCHKRPFEKAETGAYIG
jgi:hypothetical protein